MRITNSMLVKNMLWNSNNNLVSMSNYQNQLSTGKKITRPSDDPVGITQVLKYKTDIREAEQYGKNIDDAMGWLEVSESALVNVKDILQRIRELAVQAANGTNTPEDTQKIKVEVEQLTQEILVSGNATNAGRYVFSGLETNQPLFNEDGTYNINFTSERVTDKRVIGYEVAVGEVLSVGIHPLSIFGSISSDSYFDKVFNKGSISTTPSTQEYIKSTFDLTHDYNAGGTFTLTLDGINYDVDETLLENTFANPLTKERVINALKEATPSAPGVNPLGDMAQIYYDNNGELVIKSNTFGATAGTQNFGFSVPGHVAVTASDQGYASTGATISGAPDLLLDADVLTESLKLNGASIHSMTFQYNGVKKDITVDFATLVPPTVASLVTAIQGQLDTAYTPAGTVTVGGSDGNPLTFTIPPATNGNINQLSVDFTVTQKSELITDLQAFITALTTKDDSVIGNMMSQVDKHMNNVLTAMGDIGGMTNRVEFIKARVEENEITFTSLLSKVQDVDVAEAIMYFKNLENIYRASLSVGSKVIQPSLVDFIS